MSVTKLQEKIRKLKNPTMVQFAADYDLIPQHILNTVSDRADAYLQFAREILLNLREVVPAVRFGFCDFALYGPEGLQVLSNLTHYAKQLGFYVALDGPVSLSREEAERSAQMLCDKNCKWAFDGLIVTSYIGSDGLKPYLPYLHNLERDLYLVVRTGNKSASEIQDLLTGRRLVHMAAAEIAERLGEPYREKIGYSSLGVVACAGAPECLKILRRQHENLFILVDGFDYTNANSKNCSYGFDKLGRGAIVCAGGSVLGAWRESPDQEDAYAHAAVNAAERMKKNLTRYTTVL